MQLFLTGDDNCAIYMCLFKQLYLVKDPSCQDDRIGQCISCKNHTGTHKSFFKDISLKMQNFKTTVEKNLATGVSFSFRVKCRSHFKNWHNRNFEPQNTTCDTLMHFNFLYYHVEMNRRFHTLPHVFHVCMMWLKEIRNSEKKQYSIKINYWSIEQIV